MGIMKNPYGVGYSGSERVEYPRDCECCKIEFLWSGTARLKQLPPVCPACRKHDMSTPQGEFAALREHQGRLAAALGKARDVARDAMRKVEDMERKVQRKSEQVAAALKSRDLWAAEMREIRLLHPDSPKQGDACGCDLDGCTVATDVREIGEEIRQDAWDGR